MRAHYFVLSFLLLCFVVGQASALPWDTPDTQRWWLRGDTHTVNDYLGYAVNQTQSSTAKNVSLSVAGSNQTWWAVRAWRVKGDNSTSELTDGSYSVNVTRTTNSSGLQNVTWTPPLTSLSIGNEAVRFYLYIKVGAGSWSHKATFITSHLETNQIVNATWTFRLYTYRNETGGATVAYFWWGDTSYETRIDNVQLAKLSPWETMTHHLVNADFISFLVTPWTYYIGNAAYGVAVLFIVVTTYSRYQRVEIPIVLCWIFGGTGGALTLLIPAVGLHLSWFLLAFALASTLLLLFR